MENITIRITKETAKALLVIDERYYFDMFESIRTQSEEEYCFRDAITEIANKIKRINSHE